MECPLRTPDADGWRGEWTSSKSPKMFQEAIAHVREHITAGHTCHPDTIPRLIEDDREEQGLSKTKYKKAQKKLGK